MNEEIKDEQLLPEVESQGEELTNSQSEGTELNDVAESEQSVEEQLRKDLAQLQDTHLRLVAEYDNYRKRTLKEKSELIRSGGERVLTELLPVVDDLDLALQNIESATDIEAVKQGISLIYSKFTDYLSRQGVKAIDTQDRTFDDELDEAIALIAAPSEEQKGRIIDCVKKGYTLHDKVIRHAHVVVGQ